MNDEIYTMSVIRNIPKMECKQMIEIGNLFHFFVSVNTG